MSSAQSPRLSKGCMSHRESQAELMFDSFESSDRDREPGGDFGRFSHGLRSIQLLKKIHSEISLKKFACGSFRVLLFMMLLSAIADYLCRGRIEVQRVSLRCYC
jgi:hypothetical protein